MKKLKTLEQLITAAKLDYTNSDITTKNFPDTSDVSKLKFELVNMGKDYREGDAIAETQKRGLRAATAYELAYYAGNGWNGTDTVVAFGSSYARPIGGRYVAYLWSDGAERRLYLLWADNVWSERVFVLCVCESNSDTGNLGTSTALEPLNTLPEILTINGKTYRLEKEENQ